jgi:hypothetical protein
VIPCGSKGSNPFVSAVFSVRPSSASGIGRGAILARGRARWGARGPLYRKPSTCRTDYPSAAWRLPSSLRQAVWMVGSCATRSREPGQARKGAAVSGVPGAPQGCPAGAGCRKSVGGLRVQDGVHGLFAL